MDALTLFILGIIIICTSPFWFIALIVFMGYIFAVGESIVVGIIRLIEVFLNLFKRNKNGWTSKKRV